MTLQSTRFADLILGEKRERTRRALILAAVFVVAGAVLDYLVILSKFENEVFETLNQVFLLDGYLPSWHASGVYIVIGLAAVHAYLNEGYLPSILLGWSPIYGSHSWTIIPLSDLEAYYLDPVSALERTFPEAVVLATLGFVIGLSLRRLRRGRRGNAVSHSEADEIRSAG
jgi:hypothetical protein